MLQSWRWFGPGDPIALREIRQAGATDIVTALHEVPCGEPWTPEAIAERVREVEAAGLRWTVVESVAVHEDLKTRTGNWQHYLEVYRQNLRHLAAAGVKVVCYNFMPLLDWTRTDVEHLLPDGSRVLRCDGDAIAAFALCILKRVGAEANYDPGTAARARALFAALDAEGAALLSRSILLGLPGTVDDFSVEDFRQALRRYDGIDADTLRVNLHAFLADLMPLCEALGIRMAIHPDDPPRPIFGLPRVMSTAADLERLFEAVPSPCNGVTLCTGSFGGRQDNDPAALFERFAHRVHFAHFRNVAFTAEATFHESSHLEGHVDMARAMLALLREESRRRAEGRSDWAIPLRPDHGRLLDCDVARGCYAGYSYVGRAIGLAELRGLEYGLKRTLEGGLPCA